MEMLEILVDMVKMLEEDINWNTNIKVPLFNLFKRMQLVLAFYENNIYFLNPFVLG